MTQAKLRLLLLSVGGGVAQNFLDALGARRERCILIGTNSIADAASSFRCDTVYLVPPADSGAEYIERIVELIREEQPDLVIPCRDDDVVVLAMIGERYPRGHAALLTGSVKTARLMHDKAETARFAARNGLPFAPTAENVREALDLATEHGLPLIGKPRSGNASQGVVLLRSTTEIERAFASRADLIAQPYLDPPPNRAALMAPFEGGLPLFFSLPGVTKYSVQLLVGPEGAISKSFGTLSTEVGGRGTEYRRRDDVDLLEVGHAYAKAVVAEGWKGPLNVQLKRTPAGQLVAFELNGRFTGGTSPRTLLGFDEIGEVISRFLPGTTFPSIPAPESDVVQNYLVGHPVPRHGVAALRTVGRWSSARDDVLPKPGAQGTETKLRLLLLSVGSRVPQRLIDALGARRERCVLIGTNSVADAAGNFRCDTVYLVPPAASGAAYIERITELIGEERPDLVIPGRDDDVLALALLGEQSPRSGVVLLTGTVAAARMMNDKVETARFAARHGLPFAATATNAREALALAQAHGLPLIGKPRSGNASLGVVLLRSTAEIERAFESSPDLIAQPYLDPPPNMDALIATFEAGLPLFFSFPETHLYVIQLIVGPDRAISSLSGGLGIQVRGEAIQITRCEDPGLLEVGRAYGMAAAAEGWKGPLNVQLKRTPADRFVAFELNGRFTGTMAERVHMGFDEIADVVTRFLPGTAFPSIAASKSDVGQRYLYSYPLPREAVAALETTGKWSRPPR